MQFVSIFLSSVFFGGAQVKQTKNTCEKTIKKNIARKIKKKLKKKEKKN